jgi:hypothetical protein
MVLSSGLICHILQTKKGNKNNEGLQEKRFMQGCVLGIENLTFVLSIYVFPDAICCK